MPKSEDTLTKEQAKEMLAVDETTGMVHTFLNAPLVLVGGDHSKESLYKDIDMACRCLRTGEQASAMGHGLAIIPHDKCKQSDILFVETKPEKKSKKRENTKQ